MTKKLDLNEVRNGYLMTRVFKEGQYAIYERLDKTTHQPLSGFELIKIRTVNLRTNNPIDKSYLNQGYTEKEDYPGSSRFGIDGWDFVSLNDALSFYHRLEASKPMQKRC